MTKLIALVLAVTPVRLYSPIYKGGGTGFVVADGYIMTCNHVAINDLEATHPKPMAIELVKHSEELDIALYKADIRGNATFGTPEVGQEVTLYGYPFGLGMELKGIIVYVEKDIILLDMTCPKGASGSALIHNGRVVAMLRGYLSDGDNHLCAAIPSNIIKDFLNE